MIHGFYKHLFKSNLFSFKRLAPLALLLATVGAFLLFAQPTHAAGEIYSYTDTTSNKIQVTSGFWSDWYSPAGNAACATNPGRPDLIYVCKQNAIYTSTVSRSKLPTCQFVLTLTPASNNKGGSITFKATPNTAKNYSTNCDVSGASDKRLTGFPKAYTIGAQAQEINADPTDTISGENTEAGKWAIGDTSTITPDNQAKYTDEVIRQTCSERFNNADNTKYYDPAKFKLCVDNATAARNAAISNSTSASSCTIEGIGWIICPVMDFLAKIVDAAYKFVTSLLTVQPLLATGETAGIYDAWVVIRNIANVSFVIAFLIIIFSQLTNMGVSNYGVKKMIPRLIIAAILVNVSYWICAIAVDLSNVFGASMLTIFDSVEGSIKPAEIKDSPFSTSEGWEGITGIVLAGGAGIALYVGLSALVPALLAVAIAILTVFVVLTLRQALIVLLIVVAPLAFVAYLLPNTEEWFTKWRKLFITLLLMYPIIAALFGASALASAIIMNGASGEWKIAVQIMGASIAILPLALTPLVMKSAGGVLNRIGGVVNNANRGPIDRIKKGAAGYRANRQEFRKLKSLTGGSTLPGYGANVRRREKRKAVLSNRQSELKRASAEYISTTAENDERFRGQLANGGGPGANQRAMDQALNIKASIEADEVKAATSRIERVVLSTDQLRDVAGGRSAVDPITGSPLGVNGADFATRKAAFQQMGARGDFDGMNQVWDSVNTSDDKELRRAFADSMASSSNRPAWMGQGALQSMREGNAGANDSTRITTSTQLVETAIKGNAYSPERIVSTDKEELRVVARVNNTSTVLTPQENNRLIDNATLVQTDSELRAKIGKNSDAIEHIRTNTVYPV